MKDKKIVSEGLAAYTIDRRFGFERQFPGIKLFNEFKYSVGNTTCGRIKPKLNIVRDIRHLMQ